LDLDVVLERAVRAREVRDEDRAVDDLELAMAPREARVRDRQIRVAAAADHERALARPFEGAPLFPFAADLEKHGSILAPGGRARYTLVRAAARHHARVAREPRDVLPLAGRAGAGLPRGGRAAARGARRAARARRGLRARAARVRPLGGGRA